MRGIPVVAALALASLFLPAAAFAACENAVPLIHGLDSYFACDDSDNVAALGFSMASPAGTTTGLEDIACERLFGNPRGDCLSGGAYGDRHVVIQADWANPGIEGCPIMGDTGDRIVVAVQGTDGQGLVVSLGFNVVLGGYLVEQAHPLNIAALACSTRSGAPQVTSQTTTPQGAVVLGLHFQVPIVFSDCDPGTVGEALGTCPDRFAANPAVGKVYTSVQPCVSNPDLRRSLWTDSGILPDASGNATITVSRPEGVVCAYVGNAPVIGGVESGAIVGFVAISGTGCGQDLDGDGFTSCTGDCDDSNPNVYRGHPEICDGLDNNCDGAVDEGLGTISCGVGACARTVPACAGGHPVTCVPGDPGAEVCDLVDNDCNGVVDDVPGSGVACDTGFFGVCALGSTQCRGGALGCVRIAGPTPEVCDGLDNDCNGFVDDQLGTITCGSGSCRMTIAACASGRPQVCDPRTPSPEVCDGIDNDCNGSVDDIAPLACDTGLPGVCGAGVERCAGTVVACAQTVFPSGEVCDGLDNNCNGVVDENLGQVTCGVGDCVNAVTACVNGQPQTCVPKPGSPEVCDGRDNNCNGVTDEGLVAGPCATGQPGVCAAGTQVCVAGAYQCVPEATPGPEVCDGLDNNCDGRVDEETAYILCGTGACLRTVNACVNGAPPACVPGLPSQEVCDGIDNDCDGIVDDGLTGCVTTRPPCAESVPMEHGLGSFFRCADVSQVAALAYQLSDPAAVTTGASDIACESVGNGQIGSCLSGGRVGDQVVTIQSDWGSAGVSGCPVHPAGSIDPGPQRVVIVMQGSNGQGVVASISGRGQGTGYLVEMAHKVVPGAGIVLPLACSAQNGGVRVVAETFGAGGQATLEVKFDPPVVFSDCDPDSVGWAAGTCTDAFPGTSALGDIYTSTQACGRPPDLRRASWSDTRIAAAGPGTITLTVARPSGTQCLYIGATAFIGGYESGGIFAFATVPGTACVDLDGDGFSNCQNDCNDADPLIYPGRSEICDDGVDNNCDGLVDEQDTFTCQPLAVVLSSFEADPSDGEIDLAWETALEIDSAGFDLLRHDLVRDVTVTLNPALIPATGDVLQGASYRWTDATAVNGVEYEYVLVEVETSGRRARHSGPRAVANPPRPMVTLVAPEYGYDTGTVQKLAFAWADAAETGLALEMSADPSFAGRSDSMTVTIPGAERRARQMTLNRAQARAVDAFAAAQDGVIYWRILARQGGERIPASATFRLDYR